MTSHTLIILLLGHWAGDYLFQTSKMASQKSIGIKWLTIHVGVYSLVLFVFSMFLFDTVTATTFAAVNGLLHWITDLFTSRLSKKFADEPRIFYPIIGFDQLIHTSCLITTCETFYLYS